MCLKVKRMRVESKKYSGFTLLETILATVILCGSVLALGAISTRTLGNTKLNRRYEAAMALIDKQLTVIDSIGIEQFIESGQTEGVFEEIEPAYYWKVETALLDIDDLYRVRLTVSWIERNRPYSISVDTRFNGTGQLVLTE